MNVILERWCGGDKGKLRKLATYASIAVASTLIIAKLAAYVLTDSVAMLSSLLDSTVDLLASIVTAYGVASALHPPDHDHRFGHGKAEPLAALAQAAFIVGSSILLGYEAVSRLYHIHEIQNEGLGYGAMVLSIILTAALIEFQKYVVRQTSSMAIGADRVHYSGDLAVNVAVIITLILYSLTGASWLDPLFGLAISIILSINAFGISKQALNVLMDQELPETDKSRIRGIALSIEGVVALHDMRTRTDSDRLFLELHVGMRGDISLQRAHDIAEEVVVAIGKQFPNADVTVHQEPDDLDPDLRGKLSV